MQAEGNHGASSPESKGSTSVAENHETRIVGNSWCFTFWGRGSSFWCSEIHGFRTSHCIVGAGGALLVERPRQSRCSKEPAAPQAARPRSIRLEDPPIKIC
eukprot:3368676-Amphidinium_carterae.1